MPAYKFLLARPNRWAEFALGFPSDIMGFLVGVRFYYIVWFMPIAGAILADILFTIVYRYVFYRVAYDGSDELNYPGGRFYVMTLAIQLMLFGLILTAYFRHYSH